MSQPDGALYHRDNPESDPWTIGKWYDCSDDDEKLAEWSAVSTDEQLALAEAVPLVAEPRHAPISDGILLIRIVVRQSVPARQRDPAVTPLQLARQVGQQLTWIQIELVDPAGRPVPNEPYRLELPDGGTRQGNLDAAGRAYVGDIKPGQCRVSFPQIDAKEWQPV